MAAPNDIPTLYAWYRADSFGDQADGSPVGTWKDKSGNGRDMLVVSGSPTFRPNEVGGQPAVEYGGAHRETATFLWRTNLAAHTLFLVFRTTATGTGGALTSSGGGASEAIFHRLNGSTPEIAARYNDGAAEVVGIACPIEEWHFARKTQTGGTITISLDGGPESSLTGGARVNPPADDGNLALDGGAFYSGRIAEAGVYNSVLSASDKAALDNYMRGRYFTVTSQQNERVRDVLSRRLWLRRRASGLFTIRVPLWMLDADILYRIAVESQVGPAPGGTGWRGKKWQRRAFSIQRITENPADCTVEVVLLDRRPLDVLFWDTARTDEPVSPLNVGRESGVARLIRGAITSFSRETRAFVTNPADETSVTEIQQAQRAITREGEYLEEARINEILRSSFVSGTTGLTLGGTAVNGSAIDPDAADLLFNPEVGTKSLRFTAGNPHASALTAAEPATASFPANQKIRVAVDWKRDSGLPGEGLSVRIQRGVDAFFWNEATPGWQAASVDNPLPDRPTRDPSSQWVSKSIDVGGSGTTVTVTLVLPAGGTASRISRAYHVEIQRGTFLTSRVVTDGSAVQRARSGLVLIVHPDAKVYDPLAGSFFCEVIPEWDSTELGAAEDMTVFFVTTNAGQDYDRLFYDASAASWVFERRVRGISYSATKAAAVVRGQIVALGCRWTGTEGELGLAPYTLSVFVAGAKGSDMVSEQPLFSAAGETLYWGSNKTIGEHLNGVMRNRQIFPQPLADEEIARLP